MGHMSKRNVLFLKEGEVFSVGFKKFEVSGVDTGRWEDENGKKRVWVNTKSGGNIPFKITDNVEVHDGT